MVIIINKPFVFHIFGDLPEDNVLKPISGENSAK